MIRIFCRYLGSQSGEEERSPYRLLLVAFSICSSRALLAPDDHQPIILKADMKVWRSVWCAVRRGCYDLELSEMGLAGCR
jgi:hypothetical protein